MKQRNVAFSPMHGLASLGAGGLSVSFFVWLMFLTPHPGTPVPTFESLALARTVPGQSLWILALQAAIAIFVLLHLALLVWWLRKPSTLPSTERAALHAGESHITRLITPLVMAMSVNVLFIVGLVFVPGLWSARESLFPMALLAFAVLLLMALQRWVAQVQLARAQAYHYENKGLIELLAMFAFSMIAVGFSASAAMSLTPWIHTTAFALSVVTALLAIVAGVKVWIDRIAHLKATTMAPAATGSLLMAVPIATVLGIAAYRLMMAGNHHFAADIQPGTVMLVLGAFFAFQLLVFVFGLPLVLSTGGWKELVRNNPQASSFSLVCPGVGLFVMGMFFVSHGLVAQQVISPMQAIVAYILLGLVQLATTGIFVYLLARGLPSGVRMAPADKDHHRLAQPQSR